MNRQVSKLSLFFILIYVVCAKSAWTHILPESVPYISFDVQENKFKSMYVRKHLDFEVSTTFALFKSLDLYPCGHLKSVTYSALN
jgi:hypothetical protein